MKRLLFLLLLLLSLTAQAQYSMNIYRQDGSRMKVWVNSVNRIELVNEVEGAMGEGTAESPYNVAGMTKAIFEQPEEKMVEAFVHGYITRISEVSTEYGNATYYISDTREESNALYIYRGHSVANTIFTQNDEIKVGDEVVVFARSSHRQGIPVSFYSGYIYSLNGNTEPTVPKPQPSGDGTLENPYNIEGIIAYAQSVGESESEREVFFKGRVSSINNPYNSTYGNATFYVSNDGRTAGNQFCCYRLLYLENQRFVEGNTQINVGDEVVVCGKVTCYRNVTPETYQNKAYLYSLNGRTTITASANQNANDASQQLALARLEFPHVKSGSSQVLVHTTNDQYGINYSVEWDASKQAQRWSCYQLTSTTRATNTSRYSPEEGELQYPFDPVLGASQYFKGKDPYWGSGYDHGHICTSADRLYSREANIQTFYLTNMQPQHNAFNAGLWSKMENWVRNRLTTGSPTTDTLYVCKGGTIDNTEHIQATLSSGLIVPRYFYMALLMKTISGYKAMGFWVEHLNEDHTSDNLSLYVVNIRQLEQLTGIDFFCNLPDDVEEAVESQNTDLIKTIWGLN